MKFLKKLKSSNFWVSMISAVVLILQAVFNIDIKTEYLSQIIMAMLGVLVMTGIVSDSSTAEIQNKSETNVESLTQNLVGIFTQTVANMETNMLSIITQFETIKNSFNSNENKSTEQITQSTDGEVDEKIEQIENVVQPQQTEQKKCETVESLHNVDVLAECATVEEVKSNLNVL